VGTGAGTSGTGTGAGAGAGAVLQDALTNAAQQVNTLRFEAFIGRMVVAR
jgi:hypothetical protein